MDAEFLLYPSTFRNDLNYAAHLYTSTTTVIAQHSQRNSHVHGMVRTLCLNVNDEKQIRPMKNSVMIMINNILGPVNRCVNMRSEELSLGELFTVPCADTTCGDEQTLRCLSAVQVLTAVHAGS